MNETHRELKTYADAGLRTVAHWSSLGREVRPGSACRAVVDQRGVEAQLFTRDQTLARPAGSSRRAQRDAAPPLPVAAGTSTGADPVPSPAPAARGEGT